MPDTGPPEKRTARHTGRYDPLAWDAVRVVTVGVLFCVAVTVGALVVILTGSAASDRRVKECLQVQVAELQTSYTAAVMAGRQDRQAQRELLLAQLADPAEAQRAVQRYLDRLDQADRGRTAAPPPTRNCLSPTP